MIENILKLAISENGWAISLNRFKCFFKLWLFTVNCDCSRRLLTTISALS